MSEIEIQQLIDAILSPLTEVQQPSQTADGKVGEEMRQQALLKLMKHPRMQMRQQAAELLGESRQPAALEALVQLAGDPESEVRQQALTSLEAFDDQVATAALVAALKDQDYLVRATAAELLGKRPGAQADEALMNTLKDSDSMVRATAAESLGRLEAFMAAPALRDLLLDLDQWVRYSAAESLSQIEPDEEIWTLLMNANSAELSQRLEAIAALGERGDRRAIPSLVKMLRDDPELEGAILNTLERFHDPLSVPALVELALFTEKPELREQALIQAQMLGLEATLEALASWLEPERPQFAHKAIEALHQLPTEATTPLFLYGVQHPDRWVCTVALITLEERREAVPPEQLLPLLGENIHDLVRAALRNLMTFHAGHAEDAIVDFIVSEQEWQRMALSENLGRLPAKKTYELARRLLDDPSPEVREAVLRSLDPTASEQMQELLLDGSRDSDAWVRQAAVEALGKLQKSETRGRILELLAQDEDFLVRAAAAEALAGHQVEDVRQALIEALKDAKPSVRLQATHALFAHEQLPTVTLLAQLLADEDKSVVLATLQQLRQSAQPELKAQLQPQLEPLLQSEDLQISSAAAGLS